jgi:hypothetical protein
MHFKTYITDVFIYIQPIDLKQRKCHTLLSQNLSPNVAKYYKVTEIKNTHTVDPVKKR